jgi:protoporphyrinogen oxidase
MLPSERVRFGSQVDTIDVDKRRIRLSGGDEVAYDALISTMPLDVLLASLRGGTDLRAHVPHFVHSSSHIVGIGIKGKMPEDLATKCWIYFPEPSVPFYRATVFSNYSPNNAPDGHWSMMAEVSESPDKPVNAAAIVDDVIDGFSSCGFLERTNVVSGWHRRLEHGYPTPWLGRDRVLDAIDPVLREHGIYSRGRFGAWKYEVSNQDHSFVQGAEAVEHILSGAAERTYHGEMSTDLDAKSR